MEKYYIYQSCLKKYLNHFRNMFIEIFFMVYISPGKHGIPPGRIELRDYVKIIPGSNSFQPTMAAELSLQNLKSSSNFTIFGPCE